MTDLPENIYDHPKVKELLDKIGELEAKIGAFQPQLDQMVAQYNDARGRKEAYLRSVNEQLAQYDNEMRQADRVRREIEQQMDAAKSLKQSIHNNITQTVEELQAATRLQEVEERWERMMRESDYFWKAHIRPFQKVATRFTVDGFVEGIHGVLIADQMGLGKTLEAGASLDVIQDLDTYGETIAEKCPTVDMHLPESQAVLWVCPNSIKETTMRELRKWCPERQTIRLDSVAPAIRDKMIEIAYNSGMTVVVAYEQLRDRKGKPVTPAVFWQDYDPSKKPDEMKPREWPVVVLDEAHKFKDDRSSTFERIEQICERAGFVIPMTGTPIMNRPQEFWAILHMLTLRGKYADRFKEKWRFENEYCTTWGNETSFWGGGADRLIKQVSDMVIRRRKDEVLLDMPDKVREVRFVELGPDQRAVYDQMRDKFLIWLDEQQKDFISATSILAQLTRLRQLALYPAGVKIAEMDGNGQPTGHEIAVECRDSAKIDEAMDVLEELIDNGEKCLVFSNYNDPLKELGDRITAKYGSEAEVDYIVGTGKYANPDYRANLQDRFNDPNSSLKVVLGNIAAMGLGLNMQGACSNAIFLDLGWNPGVNEQAEDRLHRQGQKNAVTIHIIQAEDTVDGFIAQKLEQKANMIEGVMERSELRKMVEEGLI
jgi:SNF2 family DNA or RNA helicase